jgi:hypothetical protein
MDDIVDVRLLGIGLEWGNFTAAFVCCARVGIDFDDLRKHWQDRASDPYEAVALDRIDATPKAIADAIQSPRWVPRRPYTRERLPEDAPAHWHETSRARLYMLREHLLAEEERRRSTSGGR